MASVHQAIVRQKYEINDYLGINTSCVESAACGLYADKDKNEVRSFFTSCVGTSKYQIRLLRRNSTFDGYHGIRDETQKIKQRAQNMKLDAR